MAFARVSLGVCCILASMAAACSGSKADPEKEVPPAVIVDHVHGVSLIEVARPERFPVVQAISHASHAHLVVTGSVSPDIDRDVPVVSMASGRVLEVRARLGDTIKKGQLLVRIESSDVSQAFSDYQKAAADENLAASQLVRARDLFGHGAISRNDLQVAENAETKAQVDLRAAKDRVQVLGGDPSHPSAYVDIRAPISGVIVEQNVTPAAGVKTLDNSPSLFTIADLSRVWVLCDVYENDLAEVRVGDTAEIRLDAYPDRPILGRVSNISPTLDPNLRTAKVRIEVPNPGMMRVGMFVTATFRGRMAERDAAVPATAVLHLHDRDWVYLPAGKGEFRRTAVQCGETLPGNWLEIASGVQPGESVVQNALELESTVEP